MAINPESKSYLTGRDLYDMFVAGTALLERNVEAVNALNVFPVPDGDTGTNMLLTMKGIVGDSSSVQLEAGRMADQMARNALMEARGNSGVILSQFFKGLSDGIQGTTHFGVEELARSFSAARNNSYNAVGHPVEGTILTVISSIAEVAGKAVESGSSISDLFEIVCSTANDTVERTPQMLDVLREAGVVDAGGRGLALILEGVRRQLIGQSLEDTLSFGDGSLSEVSSDKVSEQFFSDTHDEEYGYCTQFMIEGQLPGIDKIRADMEAIADSTVVVGDETMVKVHVHSEDPGKILSSVISYGTLSRVDITNMDEQNEDFSREILDDGINLPVGIIAIALGAGMQDLFTSLGAIKVMDGGNTVNPSVRDIIDAIDSVKSDRVVLLPNNKNIIPAAHQASESSSKSVHVVESKTIPQGIAAILCFNVDRDIQSNMRDMEDAIVSIRTVEVTEAVRDVTLDGIEVKEGQLIGLIDGKLVAGGCDLQSVVDLVLRVADVSGGDLVTMYSGNRVQLDDVQELERHIHAEFPGLEVEVVNGGQPNYHLLISIE